AAIKVRGDRPVLIRDVARIEDGGSPETQAVSVNGENAVYLNVLRVPGGNTLEIVDAVKRTVAGLKDLPPGLKVTPVFDQSGFVRTTYKGLRKEIVQALVLIGLVIFLFLQNPRAVLIASIAIPISFGIILIALYASGQTLNAFTLGGLTLAMGPLVDISVVVIESIHRHRLLGKPPFQAALDGTMAVAVPTLAATMTTTAVLLPVALLAGLAKKLFAPLALTVAVGMFAGYFVSMTLTPVACRYLFGAHKEPGRFARKLEDAIHRVADGYASLLRAVLPLRWVLIGAVGALVAGAVLAATRLPSTFFPEIDESMESVYVRVAPGMSLEESARLIQQMGKTLTEELPQGSVKLVLTNVGSPTNARSAMTSPNSGPHTGFILLELTPPDDRKESQRELADRAREILNQRYAGVEFLQWPGGLVASVFANGYIAPLVVEVRNDNLAELDVQAKAVAEVARGVPGVRDIRVSLQTDYPEVRVETDREQAGIVGVTARSAAQATLEATLGNINTPSVWIDPNNGQSYYVVTSYDGKSVVDPNALSQIPVRLEKGKAVSLGAYGHIRRSIGPIAIERNQLQRAAHILMQTERRDIGSAAAELERRLKSDPRTRDLEFSFVGEVELMRGTFSGLGVALGLAIMMVFMIMASQFKSVRLPFVMLFTIPVSLVGIVMALLAAGQGFSITALMGMLMVVGIAVSNGILLVDEANRRFSLGESKLEAVVGAARTRFVPIAMTSLATVIGLVPTALALEKGTEANQPLALAVVGGLTSSTLLSLFLVPAMFLLLAKRPVAPEQETSALTHHAPA
ncbi:MAG TPA: efflux RND transporter permease subunit, partial [Polyangiaceae bacterium]